MYSNASRRWSGQNIWLFLLIFIVVWAPIPLGSNRPWAWGIIEILSFLLFTGCYWTYFNSFAKTLFSFKIPIALFLCFVVWHFFQIIPLPRAFISFLSPNTAMLYKEGTDLEVFSLSLDPGQTQISLLKTLAYLCIFLSALLLCQSQRNLKAIAYAIVCSGTFQALYGSIEILSNQSVSLIFNLPVNKVATGTFVYKNHYANYLMLCLSMGIGYLVSTLHTTKIKTQKERLRNIVSMFLNGKAVIRIALVIMVIGLVMSRSRMGNTAFFASMTITSLLGLWAIKNRSKGLTVLIISMFIIDMCIVSAWFGLDKVKERLQHTSLEQEKRDEVIRDSLPYLTDYWLTGSGMGSYYSVFPSYQGADISDFYDHAHNDYLQFAIEAGIPATLLLAMLVILSAVSALRALSVRKNSLQIGMGFGAFMAILGMLIHISVDFPLQAPANVTLFMIILAIGFNASKRHS